jgi:lysophospholipid acyltransferase (LPLAT)-like uncharacterized protein
VVALKRPRPARRLGFRLAAPLLRGYLRLVWSTARTTVVGLAEEELRRRVPAPYIGAFWHARMLWPAWAFRGPGYAVLVSDHADGELVASVVAGLGTRVIVGSSLRGGTAAVHAAARLLAGGVSVAVTPDGPLGPAERAQPGAVALASLTQRPIVPIAYAASRQIVFSSWDRFRLPLPWTRARVGLGEPLWVPPGLAGDALEPHRRALETALATLTAAVDAAHAGAGRSAMQAH